MYTNVKILNEYYKEIEKIVAQSNEFATVSDFVNHVLKELLSGEEASGLSNQEEEVIKQRLRDLGYI